MSHAAIHRTDSAWGLGAAGSIAVHLGVVALFAYGAWLGKYLPLGGSRPGTAPAGSINAQLVNQLPGGAIPMPSPVAQQTRNRLANDMPSPTVSRPHPPRVEPHSIALPAYNAAAEARRQAQAELKRLAQADPTKPDDRVQYGAGGATSFSYTNKNQGAGAGGGMSFGDANFGNLYADWVNHLRDRLQFYWGEQPHDPSMASGAKVSVTLTVHTDGSIDGLRYTARSGSIQVNSMAFQAIEQMGAAEKFPLPAGYAKSALVVNVTFELNP